MTDLAEARIGKRVRAARESAGMNQTQLARRMVDAGFAFHQQTVALVESGSRPLRYSEAVALGEIIPFADGPHDAELWELRAFKRRVLEAVTSQEVEAEVARHRVSVDRVRLRLGSE